MKKHILIISSLALFSFGLNAQVETPQPSPVAKIEQRVGLTDITLEYSRPSMKGRKIFGDLVPYGKIWRTGANQNTLITFGDDVQVGGKTIKSGTYSLYTVPNKSTWEVIFYADTENWGVPENWDEKKAVLRIPVATESLPVEIESLMMYFGQLTNDSAVLDILWEKTYVGIKIDVPTEKKAMASIESVMQGEPSMRDYFSAATYYYDEGKDPEQAKKWIDKAVEMNEDKPFWMLRQQSLIYHAAGDIKGAIKTAKKSLEGAKKAGNESYVNMNTETLKEWGAL